MATLVQVFRVNSSKIEINVEAELLFPLSEGAAICGFQTDVYGTMVDGVVITKEQAQVAFEAAVRFLCFFENFASGYEINVAK